MKEAYKKPMICSMREGDGVIPVSLLGAAAMLAGYAAARAVTNAMKARPITKLSGMGDTEHDLSMA